jgi:hypothetical protein
MGIWERLVQCCEYLGGQRDESPIVLWLPLSSPLWGLWWGWLISLIVLFCGQSSKFIYIDF